jgi:hypothetical protein
VVSEPVVEAPIEVSESVVEAPIASKTNSSRRTLKFKKVSSVANKP